MNCNCLNMKKSEGKEVASSNEFLNCDKLFPSYAMQKVVAQSLGRQ